MGAPTPKDLAAFADPLVTCALHDEQRRLLRYWSRHPANWLWGKDEDGTPLIFTRDEIEQVRDPVKPFPRWPFLRNLVHDFHDYDKPIIIDKARKMLVTTTLLLCIDWECRFRPVRRWLLSKQAKEEATQILRDIVRFANERLPSWVREAMPVKEKPATDNRYMISGSFLKAVPQNVAVGQARGPTISGVMIDEAAYQERFKAIWQAVTPAAAKLIAVTTANVGNPGAQFFFELLEEAGAAKVAMDVQDETATP